MRQEKLENLFDYLPKSKIKAGEGLEEGKYPFYTSSEIQSKYLDDFQHGPGCLVFGTGGKASVHLTTNRFSTSTDCITIKPKPTAGIDASYVFQYFKGNMKVLENGFKGAGLKHISKAYLSEIKIPHPEDINDQIRIANLLGKVEALIAQRKQHLQQLDDLLKSVFLGMFGDPVRNEKGWDASELEKLCKEIIDCPHSTPVYSDEKTGYYCVRSGDIVDGYLDLSKTHHVRREIYEERIKRYTPQIDDVVYSREGGRLGNAARILGGESICLGQRIMLFKADEENSPDFLWALLESRSFKAKLQGLVGGGAAPRVNIKDLKKITVIKPPYNIQTQFSLIAKRIDEIKSRYQQSLNDLESLYGAFSQQAFKGELDLSQVPMTAIQTEHKQIEAAESWHKSTAENLSNALPEIGVLLDEVQGPMRQQDILRFWLKAYCRQLSGTSFSLQRFMGQAHARLAELHQDDDFGLSASDYEHIKAWVFEALASGKLKQERNQVYCVIETKETMLGKLVELKAGEQG